MRWMICCWSALLYPHRDQRESLCNCSNNGQFRAFANDIIHPHSSSIIHLSSILLSHSRLELDIKLHTYSARVYLYYQKSRQSFNCGRVIENPQPICWIATWDNNLWPFHSRKWEAELMRSQITVVKCPRWWWWAMEVDWSWHCPLSECLLLMMDNRNKRRFSSRLPLWSVSIGSLINEVTKMIFWWGWWFWNVIIWIIAPLKSTPNSSDDQQE